LKKRIFFAAIFWLVFLPLHLKDDL